MSDAGSSGHDSEIPAGLIERWKAQQRFWRVLAIAALAVASLLAAVSGGSLYLAITTSSSVHAQRARNEVVAEKVRQTLTIARTFLCEQTPTPKGCPPPPPPTVSPNTQAIINDIIGQLEHIYPPPNGLR